METSKTVESSSPSLLNTALTTESTEKSPQFAGKDSISNLVSQNDPDQLNDLFGKPEKITYDVLEFLCLKEETYEDLVSTEIVDLMIQKKIYKGIENEESSDETDNLGEVNGRKNGESKQNTHKPYKKNHHFRDDANPEWLIPDDQDLLECIEIKGLGFNEMVKQMQDQKISSSEHQTAKPYAYAKKSAQNQRYQHSHESNGNSQHNDIERIPTNSYRAPLNFTNKTHNSSSKMMPSSGSNYPRKVFTESNILNQKNDVHSNDTITSTHSAIDSARPSSSQITASTFPPGFGQMSSSLVNSGVYSNQNKFNYSSQAQKASSPNMSLNFFNSHSPSQKPAASNYSAVNQHLHFSNQSAKNPNGATQSHHHTAMKFSHSNNHFNHHQNSNTAPQSHHHQSNGAAHTMNYRQQNNFYGFQNQKMRTNQISCSELPPPPPREREKMSESVKKLFGVMPTTKENAMQVSQAPPAAVKRPMTMAAHASNYFNKSAATTNASSHNTQQSHYSKTPNLTVSDIFVSNMGTKQANVSAQQSIAVNDKNSVAHNYANRTHWEVPHSQNITRAQNKQRNTKQQY